MSLLQGEYQIPQTEYAQSEPEVIEASSPINVAQNYDSLVRGSDYYENRAALLGEEAEKRNERQSIIAIGDDILAQRQNEITSRLTAPKAGVMKRVLSMIMTGQIDSSVDKARQADEIFRDLMNKESNIGSSLIGMPPTVSRQEFFLSDSHPNEWFYHAQSLLQPDKSRTIRYLVSEPDGIFKSIDGGSYQTVAGPELTQFTDLTKKYSEQVNKNLYKKVS